MKLSKQSPRQRLLKLFYPLLIKAGKWMGLKAGMLENKNHSMPVTPIYSRSIRLPGNKEISLEQFRGKNLLLVNTASDCGYTGQYQELQELQERFKDRLNIIAFPANDFKEQEKGSDEEIQEFCQINYGVRFPVSKKTTVVPGDQQHPVFQWLTQSSLNGWCDQSPEWNFSKYLLNEEGVLVNYFAPGISPLDDKLITAIGNGRD